MTTNVKNMKFWLDEIGPHPPAQPPRPNILSFSGERLWWRLESDLLVISGDILSLVNGQFVQ